MNISFGFALSAALLGIVAAVPTGLGKPLTLPKEPSIIPEEHLAPLWKPLTLPKEPLAPIRKPLTLPKEPLNPVGAADVQESLHSKEHGLRFSRATCDLLSFSTPWGSANHSICAAHCISKNRGFKGGRCIDGICNCRR